MNLFEPYKGGALDIPVVIDTISEVISLKLRPRGLVRAASHSSISGNPSTIDLELEAVMDGKDITELKGGESTHRAISLENGDVLPQSLVAVFSGYTSTEIVYSIQLYGKENSSDGIRNITGPMDITLKLSGNGYIITYSDFLYTILGGKK